MGMRNLIKFIVPVLALIVLLADSRESRASGYNGYDQVFMPVMKDDLIIIDSDDRPPNEPNILPVKFLQDVPPRGLQDRVNRLVQGINVDIPPEYDQFGYEIRRYMARIYNPSIFTDEEFLGEQIKNIRKARVIARYWQKHLEKEVTELEELVSQMDSGSSIWTSLKQNKQVTRTFVIDLQGWLDANERLLTKTFDSFGSIQCLYPELVFLRPHERTDYYNLLQTRQAKLNNIKKYAAFSLMVY